MKFLIRKNPINPLLITVPHSGNFYPRMFLKHFNKNISLVRKIEDFESEKLLSLLKNKSADILIAECSRAVIDLNRSRRAIDNNMFDGVVEKSLVQEEEMIKFGLGVIPKKSYNDLIFSNKLPVSYAECLLKEYYDPFHNKLSQQIKRLINIFNICIHIDLHTMPSKALQNFKVEPDIVLGNNFGKSCSTNLLNYFKNNFIKHGLVVEINNPYAGGYITRKYGNTSMNVHTIQIEVNRKLYMDEKHLVILKDIEKIQKIFFDILNNFDFKLTSI